MRACLVRFKGVIDRNMTMILTGGLILIVLFRVPQVYAICFEMVPDLVTRPFSGGEWWLGVGFLLFVLALLLCYTGAWFASQPDTYLANNWAGVCPPAWVAWVAALPVVSSLVVVLRKVLYAARRVGDLPATKRAGSWGRAGRGWCAAALGLLFLVALLVIPLTGLSSAPLLARGGLVDIPWSLIGVPLVLMAVWWACAALCGPAPGTAFGPRLTMFGRVCTFLLLGTFVGEALWFLAGAIPEVVSYRLYTIWAVFHIGFDFAAAAALLDVAHWRAWWPVRPAILAVAAVLLLLGAWTWVQPAPADGEQGDEKTAPPTYDEHLLARILETDERAPVVFVASSGGGSRAALFAALVLEALEREPLTDSDGRDLKNGEGKPQSWADQIVLMSSVSGGSLANAHYAHHRTQPDPAPRPLRNSFEKLLLNDTDKEYKGDLADYYQASWKSREAEIRDQHQPDQLAFAQDVTKALEQPVDINQDQGAYFGPSLRSRFADDMATDFMAPLLRGFLSPTVERGGSLTRFWEQRFGWQDVTNRKGFGAGGYGPQGPRGQRPPLLLFNATTVGGGNRFVVAFPSLPPNTFRRKGGNRSDDERFDSDALEDFAPRYELRLAEAVRLSANFPWVIPTASLNHKGRRLKRNLKHDALQGAAAKLVALPAHGALFPARPPAAPHDCVDVDAAIFRALYPDETRRMREVAEPPKGLALAGLLDEVVRWLDRVQFDPRLRDDARDGVRKLLAELEAASVVESETQVKAILDGGVNENTGIATIADLLTHLEELPKQHRLSHLCEEKPDACQIRTGAATARRILFELHRRGVVLVEIDSGAKSSDKPVHELLTPIEALNNASYETALASKERWLKDLNVVLNPPAPPSSSGPIPVPGAIRKVPMYYLKFTCNHSTLKDVMTAWALPPSAKVRIYATFCWELRQWREVYRPGYRRGWLRAWDLWKKQSADDVARCLTAFGDRDGKVYRNRLPDLPKDTKPPTADSVAQQVQEMQQLRRDTAQRFQQKTAR